MSERTTGETGEQPLFLDEPADTPRYTKPTGVPIEELFADEETLKSNPAGASEAPAPTASTRQAGGAKLALIFIAAAVLGFAAASAFLR